MRSIPLGTSIDHYEIRSALGHGGMGKVYLAYDKDLKRQVALKFLIGDDSRHQILDEAMAASALNHPNIITIYGVGNSPSGNYIAMEFIEGQTLKKLTNRDPLELTNYMLQVVDALMVAHASGITHRDIKPHNLMIRHDGLVKVLDFGLARGVRTWVPPQGDDSDTQTGTDLRAGTPRYMSPEQRAGVKVTPATDVYSLGVVFYELLTGQQPLTIQSVTDSRQQTEPSALNSQVPAALDRLLLEMLSPVPAERPAFAEIRKLLKGLRNQGPGPEAKASGQAHAVGRDAELADLQSAYTRSFEGRSVLLCVTGESGVGKTTLVESLLVGLPSYPAISKGRCSRDLAGAAGYLPIIEILTGLLHGDASDTVQRLLRMYAPTWFSELLPAKRVIVGDYPRPASNSARSPGRMKHEMLTLLRELSKLRPVVWFLDDFHWADVSTVDLVNYLVVESERLFIVAAYQPSEMIAGKHPFNQLKLHLQAHGLCREIPLGYLSRQHTQEYLDAEFPGHDFPDRFGAMIHARTEGHPLFMADLLGELRDTGIIEQQTEGWRLAHPISEIEPHLPQRVESLIELKMTELGEPDRHLLAAASVQGARFDSVVLAGTMELDREVVEDRLAAIEQAHGLVRLTEDSVMPNHQVSRGYAFVHGMYQNACFESLTPSRRKNTSLAVAKSLLSAHEGDVVPIAASLGVLFEAGGEFQKASECFGVAADKASRMSAHAEAIETAQRGLNALEKVDEDLKSHRIELRILITLGGALMAIRGFSDKEVEKTYTRAMSLLDDPRLAATPEAEDQRLKVQRGLWAYHLVCAEFLTATTLSRQVLRVAKKRGDHPLLVEAYHAIAFMLGHRGKFEAAVRYQRLSLELYNREPHLEYGSLFALDPSVGCRMEMAMDLWIMGYPDQALTHVADALKAAESLGQPYSRGFALMYAAVIHELRGEPDQVLKFSQEAIGVARKYSLREVLGWANSRRGWALAARGEPEGLTVMRQMLAAQRALGSEIARPHFLAAFAESLLLHSQTEEALEVVEEGLDTVARTGARYYKAELQRLKGECRIALNASSQDEVEALYVSALETAARQKARSWELRATMSLARLSRKALGGRIQDHLAEQLDRFDEGHETADLTAARGMLTHWPPPESAGRRMAGSGNL